LSVNANKLCADGGREVFHFLCSTEESFLVHSHPGDNTLVGGTYWHDVKLISLRLAASCRTPYGRLWVGGTTVGRRGSGHSSKTQLVAE